MKGGLGLVVFPQMHRGLEGSEFPKRDAVNANGPQSENFKHLDSCLNHTSKHEGVLS